MKKLGIVGFGFVGRAVAHGFMLHADIKVYDKYQEGLNTLEDTVNDSDILFICVPTPADENGKQDDSILQEVMKEVDRIAVLPKIIVFKSTVEIGTTDRFQDKYPRHNICHVPEFLTERAAKLDFINTARVIIGGRDVPYPLIKLFSSRFPHTPMHITSARAAEFVKYMCNCFFAMKVSFMNECYDACKKLNIPYEQIKKMFLADMRIGNSHVDVPGHDGDRGYGGKCFPKDVQAMITWGEENGVPFTLLEATHEVNNRVRRDRDWERIKGATTKYNYGDEDEKTSS